MYLQRLTLTQFKNCPEAELSFSEKINCFVGDNGAGKTNILDAVYYLSFCKSFLNPQDNQNIRHDDDFFAIHGYYYRNGDGEDVVSCIQRRNQKKQFRLNKKDYERLADHIGLLPLVMVSPSDADLINLGSDERRKYTDSVICQFDKIYLDHLLTYNKILQQRNALLKQMGDSPNFASELEIWDRQMVEPGAFIHQKRKVFFEDFIPTFRRFFRLLSGGREEVGITYESQLHDQDLAGLLHSSHSRDLAVRYTTKGIHKDDMVFTISGYPVKKFGSQGQQKSFLVALKLAQFEFTRQVKGFKPVLLFDDVFDKLDETRVAQLVQLVGDNNFGQVFITDTHADRIEQLFRNTTIDYKIFKVEQGSVQPM